MNEIVKFEKTVQKALDEIGSGHVLSSLISDALECKTEIEAEELADGRSPDVEFWNYLSDGVASIVILIEKDLFSVYILKERIENVTPVLDKFSMSEVTELKEALISNFGQSDATAILARSLAEYWLST